MTGALPGLFPGGCPQTQQVGAPLPRAPRSPFQLGPFPTGIFVMWRIFVIFVIAYQQYFSGFFQLPFPEIPGFKRKAASANPALAAAVPALGASPAWCFLHFFTKWLKKH